MEVIIRQTIVCSIVVLAGFYVGNDVKIPGVSSDNPLLVGRTMAFLILGWTSVLHIFTVRSRVSVFRRSLFDNPQLALSALLMFLVLAAIALIPGLNTVLGFIQMSVWHWLIALGLALLPTLVAEYGKFWDNYKFKAAEKNRVTRLKI